MVIFKPFKVGDYVEAGGAAGTVETIQIFTTTLNTPDNKTVIIPNSGVTGGNIINWTVKGTRRVDMVFGIGYDDDIDTAKQIMADVLGVELVTVNTTEGAPSPSWPTAVSILLCAPG